MGLVKLQENLRINLEKKFTFIIMAISKMFCAVMVGVGGR